MDGGDLRLGLGAQFSFESLTALSGPGKAIAASERMVELIEGQSSRLCVVLPVKDETKLLPE